MPNLTENYGLKKPLSEEFYDIQVQNDNMDIIDSELKKRAILGEDGKVPEEQLPDITNIPVTSEVPSDSDIWIDPNDVSAEEAHITNTNNPHGVTIAQIGAAPAGYGLGGGAVAFAIENIDNMKSNGWFYATSANGYYIGTMPIYYVQMRVDSWKDTSGCSRVMQTIYYDSHLIQRICVDDTWVNWEWVNPLMQVGVEYRTTERWDGKAVFTQLLDLGSLPANTTATYSGLLTTATKVNSMELIAYTSDYQQIPLAYHSGITSVIYNRAAGNLIIKTNTTFSNIVNVYLKVKYTDYR